MKDNILEAKEILAKYKQEHLLDFFDEISEDEKQKLINQILNIDFEKILNLYSTSMQDESSDDIQISPLPHIEKDKLTDKELNSYIRLGEALIKSNQIAVVTMAGGQGTRLGYKGPKGTYVLGTGNHVVAVVNGDYYDMWDSGDEIPAYVWYKKEV